MEYKGHSFNERHSPNITFKYFNCEKCNLVIFDYLNSGILEISKDYNNPGFGLKNEFLTCDEVIIKNILE